MRSGGMTGGSGVRTLPVAVSLTGPVAKYPNSPWVTTHVGSIQTSVDPGCGTSAWIWMIQAGPSSRSCGSLPVKGR